MKHHPRKRFRQNFLHDPAVINRIAAAISAQPNHYSVEIVPSPWVERFDAIEDTGMGLAPRDRTVI